MSPFLFLKRMMIITIITTTRIMTIITKKYTVGGQKKLHLRAQEEQGNYKHKWDT